ncbi:GAF sensor hybrid histidine kinase [Rhizobium sp. NFR07]|uniref:response regulator n=1 Tax=Rhizobium sp. NFR07 TaxID=1566262 RepID=UPI0008E822F0|nr:response regulator [Rhizobium sp. NFR07]SFB57096.1 GAF sensor hybrid histidine kinase [Rhizobium sp. NFR07]
MNEAPDTLTEPDSAAGLDFLSGGGEMGALLRAHDWAATALGPPQDWPQSLKTAVRIMLLSRQPIWIGWGEELTYFYNDSYKSIIGGKHPWALGKPTAEVWREIWDDIGPMLATAMGGHEGTYVEEQLLIMERNGYPEETYYTFSYTPIPDDDGTPGGIICANTDDTQRVVSERQLALLRELATTASDARSWRIACERGAAALSVNAYDVPFALLYMTDADTHVAELVASCGIEIEASGFPAAIRIGGASIIPIAEALYSQRPVLVEDLPTISKHQLPTGGWRIPPQSAAVVPIMPTGETGRSGALVVGLNPYRLFDDDYRSFLQLVAGQIAGSIANAQAYEEERRRAEALAELDRAKTTFFSNVSHEFRTPLTLMLGPLEEELADVRAREPEAQTRLEVVHRNGMRLLKLVNSLLDFARIEAGRAQASFEPLDLSAVTGDLASNFRSLTEKAGLRLVVDCAPSQDRVFVDRDMWEKIVLNLLSNAFKFTFDGEIRVGLIYDADEAVLSVEDTGTGIPAGELPRLFERFHRVDGAKGRSFEGSGIGLALVQELVKLHGGAIEVESEEGRGTKFTVRMPKGAEHLPQDRIPAGRALASTAVQAGAFFDEAMRWLPDDPQEQSVAVALESAPFLGPSAGGRLRIVLADDNADMREYVSRLLSPEYDVETVSDGLAALEAIRSRRPDLVLSDVMMPRLDGFGLIQAIRQDPGLAELPVIILSARAGEEASVEGLNAGAEDYLVKPFSARELTARVAATLAMARVRREMGERLREEARSLETLNRVGSVIAGELDLDRAVQAVTDAATELTGAEFGSFFYNVFDEKGESYMLYTLSGVPREAFSSFPMPRNTAVFGPTFAGEGIVRVDDITKDPRYGKSAPHHGMPKGHLPVCSYLAAPVISRTGEVLGGLFFGHSQPGIFTDRAERLLSGIAAQAAIAIDNARLYRAAQREIAERTKTEEALRRSEARLSHLNENLEATVAERTQERDRTWNLSHDLLGVADRNGVWLSINPAWTTTLGWPQEEIVGKTSEWLEHPDDQEKTRLEIEHLAGGGVTPYFENRFRCKDGTYRWLSWTAVPEGNLLYCVARDVTVAKQQAETLRNAEEQLRQSQKLEAVGNLTGGVAHDFNNLLQVIGGNLQLLSKDLLGHEKAQRRLENALAGVSRGSKLASQLLAFGRRQPLEPKVVNLGRLIRGLDDMLRRALGEAIEIETIVSGGLWNTLIDPGQAENALLNLAINARDAMEGHGKLTIEAGNASLDDAYAARHSDVTPGQYVMLAVTDTGSGMSPEVMEQAFEPFFTTKPTGKGTGLGLSMVWGLVKQSGGHIKIYSEPGEGTTIRIYLPRSKQVEDLAVEIDNGPVVGGTETILVVEDDEAVRTTVIEMLTDLGYRVLRAVDAQTGLAVIESGVPIDLLFTDVVMPGPLRSPELARKARERLPQIAILFTSGYTENAIVHGGRLDEDIELLSKPYTREAMASKIRHVLGKRQPDPSRRVEEDATPSRQDGPATGQETGPLRILVVEDEPLILMSTTDMLETMGHIVLEAASAEEALSILEREAVDVLLTDQGLPGMSGAELAVECRRRRPKLGVIFASGAAGVPSVEGGDLTADAIVLPKPYDDGALATAIEQVQSGPRT